MRKQLWSAALALGLSAAALGVETWKTVSESTSPEKSLRGYGPVAVTAATLESTAGRVEQIRFRTASGPSAQAVAGKFLDDLQNSQPVRREALTGSDRAKNLFVTSGNQAFAVLVNGAEATILGAETASALRAYFAAHPEAEKSAISAAPFPQWMNRWAWGTYGMGGFENFHGWMSIGETDRRKNAGKDPTEDMEFLKQMGNMHFDNWIDHAGFDTSDGIFSANGWRWKLKYANERGIPYSHRVYVNEGRADWSQRRFAEYLEQPAPFLQSGWHGTNMHFKAQPHLSWYARDVQNYLGRQTQKMMEAVDGPANRGWMHPHGELVHDSWYDMHSDYSKIALEHWHNYLRKHGVTLAEANRMFRRGDSPFVDYAQIPIPEFATFNGLPGRILPLAGAWRWKSDAASRPNDPAWRKTAPEQRWNGLKNRWYAPGADLTGWGSIDMPGSEQIYGILKSNETAATWFRRSFDYHPALAAGKRVYLYFYPISRTHAGAGRRYHAFYLNGKKVGEIGSWGALDVTDALKDGVNEIAFLLHGARWNGRIYLSTAAPEIYPHLGPDRNKLWDLWNAWRSDAKYDAWAAILDAMRQAEPDKPVKFMAPLRFGTANWVKLARNYGGWAHFTGEGSWYFPWYKRYGKLYGIPGTSELAGPADTLEKMQRGGYRRVFLAGLDGHEPVFLTQTYSRNPELRKWWFDHKDVLHRMGKYDIAGPQVLMYRSTGIVNEAPDPYPAIGDAAAVPQTVWDWDIGRGSLQTIGQSCLYLDDNGVADGKMYGYPLIFDCGNQTLSPKIVAGLKQYVKAGGTLVTLPFTGRHAPAAADSWPVSELTGCRVTRTRPLGGKVVFARDTKYFPGFAGKTFDDRGKSINCNDDNLNTFSAELQPGPDSTVEAVYENGKPAIVVRRLGKGRVIALGTAFWRDATDRNGVWYPGKGEPEFLAALLKGAEFPDAWCETDDPLVWPQPYRSNHGLDRVAVFVNWNEQGVQTPNCVMRLPRKPARLTAWGVDGVKSIPFEWRDGEARFKLEMPAAEVKVVAAEVYGPKSALTHWWNRQNEICQATIPATGDFAKYDTGKWADPTQDLSGDGARFTNQAPDKNWIAEKFDDSRWTRSPLDAFTLWGAKPGAPVWVRKTFDVPPEWLRSGDVRLISAAWAGPQYLTPTRLILNGTELHGFRTNGDDFNVTRLLRPTGNVLGYEMKGGPNRHVGVAGNVYLYFRGAPERSLDLGGAWRGTDGVLTVPGAGRVTRPVRSVFVPREWENRYRVRLYMEGQPYSVLGVRVNGKLVRRHHHNIGSFCDLDLTGSLKFGAENTLELVPAGDGKNHNFQYRTIRLDLYPVQP